MRITLKEIVDRLESLGSADDPIVCHIVRHGHVTTPRGLLDSLSEDLSARALHIDYWVKEGESLRMVRNGTLTGMAKARARKATKRRRATKQPCRKEQIRRRLYSAVADCHPLPEIWLMERLVAAADRIAVDYYRRGNVDEATKKRG